MAYITFYDSTQTDKTQLENQLHSTDHHREYVAESITTENLHPDSEVISVFVTSTVTREIIEKLPKLRLIACRSTGFDHIDLIAAAERNITVVNVPSYGEHTVAEYAFALILALSRKLSETFKGSANHTALTGFDLNGKTFGTIGMGRIGQSAARIAKGFGMRVIAYDPYPNQAKADEIGYEYASLDEIAFQSDVISLHAPYTKDNHHIVNQEFLGKVKPTAILVNTARGELVDTPALVANLKNKTLAGAALDVLEGEKQHATVENSPNLIHTPHIAFNTTEAIGRINQITVSNIIGFWQNEAANVVELPPVRLGKLVLARHGESEWNVLGKWTGTTDVHLTKKGFHEAAQIGEALQDTPFDYAFCSQQIRTLETLESIFDGSKQLDVPFERSDTINERDYGDFTGMNKWEVRDKVGEEEFNRIRRDWDHHVANGETLKQVYERAIPFYKETILPKLREGQTVLVVSHGNAIRALIKYLENINDEGIANIEMPFGKVMIYQVDDDGRMTDKQERTIDIVPPHA